MRVSPIVVVLLLTVAAVPVRAADPCDVFEEGVIERGATFARFLATIARAAEQGNASAQWAMGFVAIHGCGTPVDDSAAVTWFRRAAEQGVASAQHRLGWMYTTGRGVPQNYGTAVQWLRRAAEQGHSQGQGLLGALYGMGYGVPQDFVLAYMWLDLAAARGDETARAARDNLAVVMTRDQIEAAQHAAREWTETQRSKDGR